MKTLKLCLVLLFASIALSVYSQTKGEYPANYAKTQRFKALIYYSDNAEEAHVEFAKQAVNFFKKLNYGNGFYLDITKDMSKFGYEKLTEYSVIIMINAAPTSKNEREVFEKYMENGGGWIGFHAAAYNDRNTNWPWFVKFLGGGVFYCNNWPPQPALMKINKTKHIVMKNIPKEFVAPASEWYQWNPSPSKNKDIEVLLSLSPKNYPIGIKDVVNFGDFPIVWTNKKYRMIYLNMGHGDEEFIDATQNLLFVNAFRWIVSLDPKGDPFTK
ncbi:MAG: ThuA domain-containing protein [Bacteroidales bacterium]|nr:ThuA domain-containing protein [Bacteroidales bacterium]